MADKRNAVKEGDLVACRIRDKKKNGKRVTKMSESVAFLIEDTLAKSEVVLAVQSITDKLQDIAEDLSTVEAKEIMPVLDSITAAFGPQVSDQFNSVATEQVRQLISAVQQAKSSIDKEVLRMKQGIEGGDMSDMGMDAVAPEEPAMNGEDGEAPLPAPPAGGMPEVGADEEGNAEDDELGNAFDAGFAGRAKKENAAPRGKKLGEDFLGGETGHSSSPAPAIDQHPHKSVNFDANVQHLAHFHNAAGRLARNIESMIDSEALTGDERKALANVLSHLAMVAHDPSHFMNPEHKVVTALQTANLWDHTGPAVSKIVAQLKRLAYLLSIHHDGLTESAIKSLRNSSDPDAMVLKTFRTKLAESRDAQMAAIRTARLFAIDVDDVIAVVREAVCEAQNEDGRGRFKVNHTSPDKKSRSNDRFETKAEADKFAKGLKSKGYHDVEITESRRPIREFEMHTPASAKGMFDGKTIDELESMRASTKKKIASANKDGRDHAELSKKLKRINFAIRAKHKGSGPSKWHKKVSEDQQTQLLQGATLFPISGSQTAPNPGSGTINPAGVNTGPSGQSTPPVGGPAQNPSTRRPMTPQDRRNMQAQTIGQKTNTGVQAPQSAAMFGKKAPTMVPPGEVEAGGTVPPNSQQQMASVKQVQNKAGGKLPAGQVVRQAK